MMFSWLLSAAILLGTAAAATQAVDQRNETRENNYPEVHVRQKRGVASLFLTAGKGILNAAELTSTALEAACLGVSIAELHFECGSIYQRTCSDIEKQGKRSKALAEKNLGMYEHKEVLEQMNHNNLNNLGEIDRINNQIEEIAKDTLRRVKKEGISIITYEDSTKLREQIIYNQSTTMETFNSVARLKLNLTQYAERFRNCTEDEHQRMANDLKMSGILFGVNLVFSLGPKIVPFAVKTFNLRNTDLLVIDGEFSQPDGGLSKFKQAVDRRTGKNYLLQYVNIGGKDVVKNSVKFDPWDNSKLDLIHNYRLSRTDRALAVDYLQKNPYNGPSTLQQVLDNPELKDKIKHSNQMQSVLADIRKKEVIPASVESADLNQLIDVENNRKAVHIIQDSGPNDAKLKKAGYRLDTMQKLKVWQNRFTGGDPNFRAKAQMLILEYPRVAEAVSKTGQFNTLLDMLSSKETDIEGSKNFLDRVQNTIVENEISTVVEKAGREGTQLSKAQVKGILLNENQLIQESTFVKALVTDAKNGQPLRLDADSIYYAAYKESWKQNKELLKGKHKKLKNNISYNNAKDYFMKALASVSDVKARKLIFGLGNDFNTVKTGEIRKILKDNGAFTVTENMIQEFKIAFDQTEKGLFSKESGGTESFFKKMIGEKLGLDSTQAERFLDGLKNEKSITPEKLKKVAKKNRLNINLDPQVYELSNNKYIPLETKFASQYEKYKHKLSSSWKSDWKSDWNSFKLGWKDSTSSWSKFGSASFGAAVKAVGVGSTGLSFFTCAAQQLGKLSSKENNLTDEITKTNKALNDFEATHIELDANIVKAKKEAITLHCNLSKKFVSFIHELTGNQDKPVKYCSSIEEDLLVGRNLTFEAISKCYGTSLKDNPYKNTECSNVGEDPSISEDYTSVQDYLYKRLKSMSSFLEEQKDLISKTLSQLEIRYNIQYALTENVYHDVEGLENMLKAFGYKQGSGEDFTSYSILKIISSDVTRATFGGYPLACLRNGVIKDDAGLKKWKDEQGVDTDKLNNFTEAVTDEETLQYLFKKAKKGKYHFSVSNLSQAQAEEKILKEIATRVLPTQSIYIDEDGKEYNLDNYRGDNSLVC